MYNKITSLKELRNDFKKNIGLDLYISGLGTFEILNDGKVFVDHRELYYIHELICECKDFGKVNFDNTRQDFYFKNGKKAFTIWVK